MLAVLPFSRLMHALAPPAPFWRPYELVIWNAAVRWRAPSRGSPAPAQSRSGPQPGPRPSPPCPAILRWRPPRRLRSTTRSALRTKHEAYHVTAHSLHHLPGRDRRRRRDRRRGGTFRMPSDNRGYAPVQPIAYSHACTRATTRSRVCTATRRRSADRIAGVPAASTCRNPSPRRHEGQAEVVQRSPRRSRAAGRSAGCVRHALPDHTSCSTTAGIAGPPASPARRVMDRWRRWTVSRKAMPLMMGSLRQLPSRGERTERGRFSTWRVSSVRPRPIARAAITRERVVMTDEKSWRRIDPLASLPLRAARSADRIAASLSLCELPLARAADRSSSRSRRR